MQNIKNASGKPKEETPGLSRSKLNGTLELAKSSNSLRADITARKLAEIPSKEKLEELRRLATVVSDSNDAVILHDLKGKILAWNRGAKEIYGYTEAEASKMNVRDIVAQPDRKAALSLIQRIAQGEIVKSFELRRTTKDGRILDVWLTTTLLTNEKGKPVAIATTERDITERKRIEEELKSISRFPAENPNPIMRVSKENHLLYASPSSAYILRSWKCKLNDLVPVDIQKEITSVFKNQEPKEFEFQCGARIFSFVLVAVPKFGYVNMYGRDITDRKKAEEALRKSEESFRNVFDNATIGLYRTTPDGQILLANPTLIKMLGYDTFEQLVERNLEKDGFEPQYKRNEFRQQIEKATAVNGFEAAWKKMDGTYIYVREGAKAIRDAKGKVQYYEGTVEDITERKKAEEEIHKLNLELERRVIERTAQLAATNNELETFSYSVSHDLRAPLRSMTGFSEALLEEYGTSLDPHAKDYLQRISDASHRMGRLVDDLLRLSRVTRSELKKEKMDLGSIARDVAKELQNSAPERDVRWVITPDLFASADPELMRIVLSNLLGNAWKFTGKHPTATIEFGCKSDKDELIYYVKDDGAGFDMQYVSKLFDTFQRLHPREEFDGEGIGLSLVRRIIQRHGGKIWAEGKPEAGASFYFTIP